MSTVNPNELKITLNTNIPGFQKIEYTPTMTIPNISKNDTSVQFNPFVKLNQVTVNSIPENIRIQEFFNKGLFQSLLNYTRSKPVKSLKIATQKGYIDNNIKVTLDTIFQDNSVIYVNKKPYVITDVQWSKGDWILGKPSPKKGGYYPPTPYYPNPYRNYKLPQKPKDNSANSYHITIGIETYPGTEIPDEEVPKIKCNKKWNAVRKAYSDFTGKPYTIIPHYDKTQTKSQVKPTISQNKTLKRTNVNNKTRKNYNSYK